MSILAVLYLLFFRRLQLNFSFHIEVLRPCLVIHKILEVAAMLSSKSLKSVCSTHCIATGTIILKWQSLFSFNFDYCLYCCWRCSVHIAVFCHRGSCRIFIECIFHELIREAFVHQYLSSPLCMIKKLCWCSWKYYCVPNVQESIVRPDFVHKCIYIAINIFLAFHNPKLFLNLW